MECQITPLPSVAILAEKFQKGCANLADAVDPMIVADFKTAFNSHYATDAHFATYQVTGTPAWPRLRKPVLSRIRTMGQDVVSTMLVLDYDNPPDEKYMHGEWKPGGFAAFLGKLADVAARWPMAMQWALLYATRGGARLVYVLDDPLPVDQIEQKVGGMVNSFRLQGIEFDKTVWDWTRCFRFPFVTRDHQQTWFRPEADDYIEQLDNRIDVHEIPNSAPTLQNEYADLEEFSDEKPDKDHAMTLMQSVASATGRLQATEFATKAKKRLTGRECFPCLYECKPLAMVGARGSTLLKYVGQAISLLYYLEGTTPAHIYALFLPAVEQFEAAPDVPDWTDELWRMIGRNWMREDAKAKAVLAKAEEEAVAASSLEELILEGMREWCHHPDLMSNDKSRSIPYLERHLIASVGQSYFIMNSNGRYDATPLSATQLIAAIRSKGMAGIINTKQIGKDGVFVDRDSQKIVNEYATIAQEIWAVPQIMDSHIEEIDTCSALLKVPCYGRSDSLTPTFDREVDGWLQALFEDHYDLGCKWIAWALAFDEGPICALSLSGKAGAGKKLLAQGLAECLRSPRLASADDLMGDYNYGLLSSPFLVVNEGWPTGAKQSRHPADTFRSLVAGDPLMVKRKYMAPVNITNPMRVLFTANNLDVVKMLCARRELSPEDREALAIRLLHIDISESATDYLISKGGMRYTSLPGRRWIRADGGAESNFIVAKHFLYLYETRHNRGGLGSRFLVEGNANQEVLFEMRTQAGTSPVVIEAVIRMMDVKTQFDGLAVVDNRVFALASEVLTYYRNNMAEAIRERLSINQVGNVFRGICLRDKDGAAFTLKGREGFGRRRWMELDCKSLLKVAQDCGYGCKALEKIVKQQLADHAAGINYYTNDAVRIKD